MSARYKAIADIDTALEIYWRYPEIGNKEIRRLFGSLGNETISRYKKAVREAMAERGVKVSGMFTVNTSVAYEVWGIDVADLEKRRAKLAKLGLAAS